MRQSNLEHALDSFTFVQKLVSRDFQALLLLVVDGQTLDDCPFAVGDLNGVAVEDTLGHTVQSSGRVNSKANPSLVTQEPASHVAKSGVGCTSSTRQASSFDDLSTSLLDLWDEGLVVPFLIDEIESLLAYIFFKELPPIVA